MEYLMTYGWAILIIAVVLGALFQLGVFNSSSFSPRAPPGACQVFRPNGPGTVTNINLMGVCTGQLPQYAAQFNGANSYVNVGNGASFNVVNAITISTWIELNQLGVDQYPVAKQYGVNAFGTSVTPYILRVSSTNTIWWGSYDGSWQRAVGTMALQQNSWYHVVGIYDKTLASDNFKIYINGVLDKTYSYALGLPTNNQNVLIGRYITGGGWFNGLISNIQVYNASLSANEIQALYIEGMGGAPLLLQNLVGWWPLNGNSNEYSGNNNNGVPTAVSFTSQYGK